MNAIKTKQFQPRDLVRAIFIGLCALSVGAFAAPGGGGPGGGGGGGGGQPPGGETGANNLSFPVILSDNAAPAGFPADAAWRFATITDPAAQCIGEAGVTPGTAVDPSYLCYYGRHVTVVSETGEIVFDGDPKVWWLQKRPANFWKALSVGHDTSTPLVVSAVDVGDLLESTPSIATRQIRVEFNLLQSIAADDTEFSQYLVSDWSTAIPAPCNLPEAADTDKSIGCFAALGMSGAVPGTEQSGNEMQGTDFGPGPDANNPLVVPGTQTLLDPTTIRSATLADGTTTLPIHALNYSNCARLVIQKIAGQPIWDPATGQWSGSSVGDPVVNIATYSTTNPWAVEITSGGSIVYGYNWNSMTLSTGTYRLTFVLDGNDTTGPQCPTTLATKFETPTLESLGTQLVNFGEATTPHLVYAGDSQLGDEGGLAYIDLTLTTKGGGKKGGGGRP